MDFLQGLNSQQQQAVMAGTGPILVLAGPGSGKTRVLTHRIAYLIGVMGVRAYNILAVTFTNKASKEMDERVNGLLGEATRGLTLGTFHAICARILRRETENLPFKNNFVIFDSDDQLSVVRQALAELSLDDKRYRPTAIHASISAAKNELVLPDDYPVQNYRDEVVRKVYQRYQALLLANNALDFDDLLLWTAFLLEQNEVVRERYARRFEHVLVDEFQDTNQAQYRLLRHLSSFHRNIFVVGDTDQSIYAWRGADYRNLLRFEEDFPDTQVVLLEQNYRSTQLILDAATAVIERNPHRKAKRLFTNRGAGNRVVMHQAYDDRQEAAFVVDTIVSLAASKRAKMGDFAVMYRTNAQSRVLEETFLRSNLPYKLVGAQRFYGRREVKDVIAYLRLVHNPDDEISLTRVINVPTRGIGDKTIVTLRTQAQKLKLTVGALVQDLGKGSASGHKDLFSGRALAALSTFGNHLVNWRQLSSDTPPLALMDAILADVDYHSYIDDGTEEGKERWENVMELRRLASEYQERGLTSFLEEIALVSDQDTVDAGASVPTLMTLHAAKGLEFPIVFIVGLNDGTLPHMRSFDDPDAMHEERRLLYVGITRAKDRLYLVNSQNRTAYGYAEPCEPSRFLADIPEDLLEDTQARSKPAAKASSTPRSLGETTWQGANHAPVEKVKPKALYAPGSRVIHPVWGEGMVLSSRLQDDDEIVDIFFEQVGMKRVAASLARLQPKA